MNTDDYDDDGNNIVPCPICLNVYCPSKNDGICPEEENFVKSLNDNPMTNNNDWIKKYKETFTDASFTWNGDNKTGLEIAKKTNKRMQKFISQNFIPISLLKKFIEENEKENELDIKRSSMSEFIFNEGHNSALKLLKDKFIHE